MKCKILLPIACRSDEGITKPIIKRLKEQEWCELHVISLVAADYEKSYEISKHYIQLIKPDLVYIAGDRIEMMACAQVSFLANIPICHYGSGVVNIPITTYDDIHRHCITLMSEICLCEDFKSTEKTGMLWLNIKKISSIHCSLANPHLSYIRELEERRIYNVGNVYLDDFEIDESLVPEEPYDLVFYNPTTTYFEDYIELIKKRKYKNVIWIGSNPDKEFKNLVAEIKGLKLPSYIYYDNLPRPQFLGLLSKCKRVITNSSCAYYEAPAVGLKPEQIILVGERNKKRSSDFSQMKTGASDKIVNILKKYWSEKNV